MSYIYDLSDQWAASGTVFTGIKLSVTDTASAAGSLLMDLQVGGVTQLGVAKAKSRIFGTQSDNGGVSISTTATSTVFTEFVGSSVFFYNTGNLACSINRSGFKGFDTTSDGYISWSNSTTSSGNPGDTILRRDAANTLAQRNGVNAQAFNLYNTYTDASNYERGFMRFVSNVLQIGTEKLGTGTARALELRTDGVLRMTVGAAGGITINSLPIINGNFQTTGNGNQMAVGGTFGVSEGGDQGPIIYSSGHLGWFSGTIGVSAQVPDLRLYRDAADNLAQRRGTNAQTSRIYGTYTDASNYRRLTKTMSTAGVAVIKPEGAGTGASGNVLHISGLPTSNPGPGILWNNAGTPAIGT